MAVTQQLARLSADQLTSCRRSTEELDRLCSFRLLPAADHLDLGWSPAALRRAAELSAAGPATVAALRRALDGDAEISPAYRDWPDAVWEQPVTSLDPDGVAEVSALLAAADPAVVLAAVPAEPAVATARLGLPTVDRDPRAYLRGQLLALREFYLAAARRRLAVASWWD
ncbi:hypothetical protein ABZV78_14200 [Micromonospora sp. NPDC004540]|uniref:hypothetical protein n=1 Tax=Micromonospora sp. NPDC004540 TaxID=3154457 RepID=UPI00339E361E